MGRATARACLPLRVVGEVQQRRGMGQETGETEGERREDRG